MIEQITHKKKMLALIVRGRYRNKKGIHFFTPNSATQQFGYMKHKKKTYYKTTSSSKAVNKNFIYNRSDSYFKRRTKSRLLYTKQKIFI